MSRPERRTRQSNYLTFSSDFVLQIVQSIDGQSERENYQEKYCGIKGEKNFCFFKARLLTEEDLYFTNQTEPMDRMFSSYFPATEKVVYYSDCFFLTWKYDR